MPAPAENFESVLQAVELDSKYVRGYTRAAKAHLCMGHYAQAEQLYKQALSVVSGNREAAAELQVCCRLRSFIWRFSFCVWGR